MQEQYIFELDPGDPFSSRELFLSLGGALAWVALSATLVVLLPVRLI